MQSTRLKELLNLSAEARADLAMALWESLEDSEKAEELSLSQEQRDELNRRLEEYLADPDSAVPWEEVKRRLKGGA